MEHFTSKNKCANCFRAYQRRYHQGSREKHGGGSVQHLIYGMELADLERMRAAQGNKCAICGNAFTKNEPGQSGIRPTDGGIDHDHVTGAARGILCASCNWGLGQFKDNPELMERAAAYVRHHTANPSPFVKRKPELRGMRRIEAIRRGDLPTPPAPPPRWVRPPYWKDK